MTKQELEKFEEMQDAFQTRCERICKILTPLNESYKYVYDFSIDGDDVCGCGETNWQYGGYEKHYAEFPKKYIYMDDNDIRKIIADEVKKKEEEKAREKAKDEKLKAEREKAEYERLKKIYG